MKEGRTRRYVSQKVQESMPKLNVASGGSISALAHISSKVVEEDKEERKVGGLAKFIYLWKSRRSACASRESAAWSLRNDIMVIKFDYGETLGCGTRGVKFMVNEGDMVNEVDEEHQS